MNGAGLREAGLDFPSVTLSSGLHITMHRSWGRYAHPLVIEMLDQGGDIHIVEIPLPSGGIGGGRFVVSPTEKHVVVSMFSGQSEEGYELFAAANVLTRIGGLEHVFGERATFGFSPAETQLVMAVPLTGSEWWSLWDEAVPDSADTHYHSIAYGNLYVHDVAAHHVSAHELRVTAPRTWRPSEAAYDPEINPRFVSPSQISLNMPWGNVELPMPLPSVVSVEVAVCNQG